MIWSRKRCPVCDKKLKSSDKTHEMRLETSEGAHTLEICEACADFFDKSAEVIMKGRSDESL
jgi:RNase P subunit RPR2